MGTQTTPPSPRRITDLVAAKKAGADVALGTVFEILPVDFHHQTSPFEAVVFLARYQGRIDEAPFAFRKCYARGCPNNLCPHVSQAVNIANRYLMRDYHTLKLAGIDIPETLFRLDDMVVKFDSVKDPGQPALTIPELIGLAKAGSSLSVAVRLESLPAVEHFANQENAQTYLSGEFTATTADRTYLSHRCFACYGTDQEEADRPKAVKVANARLKLIYHEFDISGIAYKECFFA